MKELVKSSNVEAIDYSKADDVLKIWFKNGSLYKYVNVEIATYIAMIKSDSIGKYYNNFIKGKYKGAKIKGKDVNYNDFKNLFYD
jgi:hypothetical protein